MQREKKKIIIHKYALHKHTYFIFFYVEVVKMKGALNDKDFC